MGRIILFLGIAFLVALMPAILYEIIMHNIEKRKNKKGIFTQEQINRMNTVIQEMCDARNQMQLESFKVLQSGVVTKEYEEAAEKCHKLLFASPKTLDWMEIPKSSKKGGLDEN